MATCNGDMTAAELRALADQLDALNGVTRQHDLAPALTLALAWLGSREPGDSRAVSDEFVAMAAVSCGCANAEADRIIDAALARIEAKCPAA